MTGRNEPLQHILQEIMLEESTPSYAALVRWCERYPRHREALEDFFAVWAVQAELPERSTIALGNGDPESGAIRVNDLPDWLRPAVEPTVVIEVAFNGIQKSDRHTSGYALRFPRIVRIRTDKTVADIDTLETVEKIYNQHIGNSLG